MKIYRNNRGVCGILFREKESPFKGMMIPVGVDTRLGFYLPSF